MRSGLGDDSLLRPPSSSLSKSRVVSCEPPSSSPPGSGASCVALAGLSIARAAASYSSGFSRADMAGDRGSNGGGVAPPRVRRFGGGPDFLEGPPFLFDMAALLRPRSLIKSTFSFGAVPKIQNVEFQEEKQ